MGATLQESASILHARSAAKDRRWAEAMLHWRAALDATGDSLEVLEGIGTALRELKMFAEAETTFAWAYEKFQASSSLSIGRAWNALAMRDWALAQTLWDRVITNYANSIQGDLGYSTYLREVGKHAEAETFLTEAVARFPQNWQLALDYARMAVYRKDWVKSLERNINFAKKFANREEFVSGSAIALRELGRISEAEALLEDAFKKFPSSCEIAVNFAWLRNAARDWPGALRRWDQVLHKFPESTDGYIGLGIALRESKLLFTSEQVFRRGLHNHPNDAQIAAEFGWLAIVQRDWPLAITYWSELAKRFPKSARVICDYGYVLLSSGQLEKAKEVLIEAIANFPSHLGVRINYALLLNATQAWHQAVEEWQELTKIAPKNEKVREGFGAATYGLSMLAVDESPDRSEAINIRSTPGSIKVPVVDAELVVAFESLGENCEFGLFQRAVGAEPLGLFRFAGTTPKNLATALACHLEGIGDPKFTTLRDSSGEYVTNDSRFGMTMHTFVKPGDVDHDKFYTSTTRRLQFLRRKLIEDLQEARKLFVYKVWSSISSEEVSAIRSAMRTYGTPRLFLVAVAQGKEVPGTVKIVNGDLIQGYIERDGYVRGRWEIPVQSWLELCKKALELHIANSVPRN